MAALSSQTIVNAWTEWEPLKHVILGRPDGGMFPAPEPAAIVGPYYLQKVDDEAFQWYGPIPKELEQKAIELMDNFATIMKKRGIRVDRPTPLDFSQKVQTPDWVQDSMYTCMAPRDVLLPVGNEIIEATMSQRSRWYEYLCYRPLLEQYFKEDPDFLWTTAPKPRLTEASYVKDYMHDVWFWSEEERMDRARRGQFRNTEKEPLFDAADAVRLGKDIFIQLSIMTNLAGIDWLRRHLTPRGIRVHQVQFGLSMPVHIDTSMICPREGLVFLNPEWKPLTPKLLELFKINDWEVAELVFPAHEKYHPLTTSSKYLGYNSFALDPKTVCVEKTETGYIEQLGKYGFEVIPVDFYDVAPFGGGLHCATVEIYREGGCRDYFPKQVAGF